MKNVMVANFLPKEGMFSFARLETYVKAQIENSLDVGWDAKDILLLANFDYEFMGVEAQVVPLNDCYVSTSKIFGVYELFENAYLDEELWVHDLDAWQNVWFDCPQFKDVGICEYSESSKTRFNGGSVFYRQAAKDIVAMGVFLLANSNRLTKEEPALHKILTAPVYSHRVTVLNPTYNVGCSGFNGRYMKSDKPICVCHFHPDLPMGLETHLLARNDLNVKTVDERLERLIRRYFDLPAESSDEAKEL